MKAQKVIRFNRYSGALLAVLALVFVSNVANAGKMTSLNIDNSFLGDDLVYVSPPPEIVALWKSKREVQRQVQDIYMGVDYQTIWSNIETHMGLKKVSSVNLAEGSLSDFARTNIFRSLDMLGAQFASVTREYCSDETNHPTQEECNPSISNVKMFEVIKEGQAIGYLVTGYISGIDPERDSDQVQDVFKYLYTRNGLPAQTSTHEVPREYLNSSDGLGFEEFIASVTHNRFGNQ